VPTKLLTTEDLKPGLRFKYQGHPVEILRSKEKRKGRFGDELDAWWSRRVDTGDEGYIYLGPGGVLRVELTRGAKVRGKKKPERGKAPMTHKSPAQLDREIAEALAKPPSSPATTALQIMETVKSQAAADETLAGIARLDGYLGGRILPPSPSKPGWRVQAFLKDDDVKDLPDGMRRVIIPAGQRAAMGIR
jgi:hypothetical protein